LERKWTEHKREIANVEGDNLPNRACIVARDPYTPRPLCACTERLAWVNWQGEATSWDSIARETRAYDRHRYREVPDCIGIIYGVHSPLDEGGWWGAGGTQGRNPLVFSAMGQAVDYARRTDDSIESCHICKVQVHEVRVRREEKRKKRMACPARVAEAGQGNIETVHEPKPIQTAGTPCMDKVAVLWGVSTAHKPRYVKGLVPSR
jgi:hypothetical protein